MQLMIAQRPVFEREAEGAEPRYLMHVGFIVDDQHLPARLSAGGASGSSTNIRSSMAGSTSWGNACSDNRLTTP